MQTWDTALKSQLRDGAMSLETDVPRSICGVQLYLSVLRCIFIYMGVLSVHHVHIVPKTRRVSDPLQLEFQPVWHHQGHNEDGVEPSPSDEVGQSKESCPIFSNPNITLFLRS